MLTRAPEFETSSDRKTGHRTGRGIANPCRRHYLQLSPKESLLRREYISGRKQAGSPKTTVAACTAVPYSSRVSLNWPRAAFRATPPTPLPAAVVPHSPLEMQIRHQETAVPN